MKMYRGFNNQFCAEGINKLIDLFYLGEAEHVLAITSESFSKEQRLKLQKLLETNTRVTSLELQAVQIDRATAECLFKGLSENHSIRALKLQANKFDQFCAAELSKALLVNDTLTSLEITDNDLGSQGVLALEPALAVNQTLTSLSLTNNQIDVEGAVAMGRAIAVNSSLLHLDLSRNKLSDEGVEYIGKALKSNSSLQQFVLCTGHFIKGNTGSFGLRGAEAIGDMLKNNTTLRTLHIEFNGGNNEACTALAAGLQDNAGLEELIISGCKISWVGSTQFAKALRRNSTLHSLDMSGNQIDNEGAIALGQALTSNKGLHTLSIRGAKIGPQGAASLAKALTRNHSLYRLNLDSNPIGSGGAKALSRGLRENDSLEELSLSYCDVDISNVQAFAHNLKRNQSLKSVKLAEKKERETSRSANKTNFYKLLDSQTAVEWNVGNVVFVGPESGGKSSTIRSLMSTTTNILATKSEDCSATCVTAHKNRAWNLKRKDELFASEVAHKLVAAGVSFRDTGRTTTISSTSTFGNNEVDENTNVASEPLEVVKPVVEYKFHSSMVERAKYEECTPLTLSLWDKNDAALFGQTGVVVVAFDLYEAVHRGDIYLNQVVEYVNRLGDHPSVLVGTHLDNLKDTSAIELIREKLVALECVSQLVCISNKNHQGVQELRRVVYSLAKENMNRSVSMRWMRCLDLLRSIQTPTVALESISEITGISAPEEVEEMLALFQQSGLVLRLNSVVVINMSWLLNSLHRFQKVLTRRSSVRDADIVKTCGKESLGVFKEIYNELGLPVEAKQERNVQRTVVPKITWLSAILSTSTPTH